MGYIYPKKLQFAAYGQLVLVIVSILPPTAMTDCPTAVSE